MGEALICGFVNAGMCTPERISVSVRSEERSQRMLTLGVQVDTLPPYTLLRSATALSVQSVTAYCSVLCNQRCIGKA